MPKLAPKKTAAPTAKKTAAWDSVDSPEITDADGFRPARQTHPEIVAAYESGKLRLAKRHRGPNKAPTKKQATIKFSPLVMDTLRGQGKGWQPRLDHLLQYLIQTNQFEKLERKAEKQLAMG